MSNTVYVQLELTALKSEDVDNGKYDVLRALSFEGAHTKEIVGITEMKFNNENDIEIVAAEMYEHLREVHETELAIRHTVSESTTIDDLDCLSMSEMFGIEAVNTLAEYKQRFANNK